LLVTISIFLFNSEKSLVYFPEVGIIYSYDYIWAALMFFRTLNFKKFVLLMGLFMLSSTVAVSDTSEEFSGSSSFGFPAELLIYGLVGSNLLSKD